MLEWAQADVRRGVEGALRRRRAAPRRHGVRGASWRNSSSGLPGPGPLLERYTRFRDAFVIPPARLDATFKAAIDGCRSRTLAHVTLPPGESFTVEYVTNKSWSGYNWYQGDYRSLIQVNTDLPIFVDRAIDLACHEGYPGHHVYNVLLEKTLVRDRGWPEFSGLPALLAAVAHRRGHGELRHRGGVSARGAAGVRARA